jgi:hypothetical protein
MDAVEIAKKSSNSFVFMWKYFLYNYFNGWFILISCLVVLYFVVLKQRYLNEIAIAEEKKENFEQLTNEPGLTRENLSVRQNSNEIDDSIAEEVRMRIDLAIAESTSAIYDMIMGHINSLDYSQSNNRKIDLVARKMEVIPKIRNILEQKADILYTELPKQEGKELKKYKIQDMLEKYVAKRMYLNLKADKVELERKIKEYNGLRNQIFNYGSRTTNQNILQSTSSPTQLQLTAKEMQSLRRELDFKNQIFKLLATTNIFNTKNSSNQVNDEELAGLYYETAKGIESFLDETIATTTTASSITEPNTYRYDPNTRFDSFYLDDIKQQENDKTAKYGRAYKDYLDAKEAEDLKIDPVELLSRVENNVIRFLETIKESKPTHSEKIKNNNADSINPINIKTDTIGNYLLDKKTQATLIEAFGEGDNIPTTGGTQTATNRKRNNASSGKRDIINSLIDYIYELLDWGYSKLAGDSYIADQIDKITSDNNQMMTVGFLFVLGSIILLMIEFTS